MIAPIVTSISRPAPNRAVIELALPHDHVAFAGHFPGHPILPGLVQIDWAVQLASVWLDSGFLAASDFQVKFREVVRPGSILSLDLCLDRAAKVLEFRYLLGEVLASSGRIQGKCS